MPWCSSYALWWAVRPYEAPAAGGMTWAGSTAESADGLQRHAAGALGGRSVGLLETNGADIAPDREAGINGLRMPASRDMR